MIDKRKVTMMDVARHAGVSVASVSVVLNNTGSISDKMREKVMTAVVELGYEQNLAARALKTGQSQVIGLIIPNLINPYFAEFIRCTVEAARTHGNIVSVIDTQNSVQREQDALKFFAQHRVSGIIWCAPKMPQESLLDYAGGAQIVVVDSEYDQFDCVCPDHFSGGQQLANYVLSLGHREFGLITGPANNYSAMKRYQGMVAALAGKGEIKWEVSNGFTDNLSDDVLSQIRKGESSAILCANDMIAVGVLLALKTTISADVQQVSITGYDDIRLGKALTPALTTIHLPIEAMASVAVNALLRRLAGERGEPVKTMLEVDLVIRDSVSEWVP